MADRYNEDDLIAGLAEPDRTFWTGLSHDLRALLTTVYRISEMFDRRPLAPPQPCTKRNKGIYRRDSDQAEICRGWVGKVALFIRIHAGCGEEYVRAREAHPLTGPDELTAAGTAMRTLFHAAVSRCSTGPGGPMDPDADDEPIYEAARFLALTVDLARIEAKTRGAYPLARDDQLPGYVAPASPSATPVANDDSPRRSPRLAAAP